MDFSFYSRFSLETVHLSLLFHSRASWVSISSTFSPHIPPYLTPGFCPHHTTEAALIKIPGDLHIARSKGHFYILVFLYVSLGLMTLKCVSFGLLLSRVKMGFPPTSFPIPSQISVLVFLLLTLKIFESSVLWSVSLHHTSNLQVCDFKYNPYASPIYMFSIDLCLEIQAHINIYSYLLHTPPFVLSFKNVITDLFTASSFLLFKSQLTWL